MFKEETKKKARDMMKCKKTEKKAEKGYKGDGERMQ